MASVLQRYAIWLDSMREVHSGATLSSYGFRREALPVSDACEEQLHPTSGAPPSNTTVVAVTTATPSTTTTTVATTTGGVESEEKEAPEVTGFNSPVALGVGLAVVLVVASVCLFAVYWYVRSD